MRTILFLIQKEFIQIFRNRTMLPIIFVMPLVQLIILVNAATFEMKHIRLMVIDQDLSMRSRQLSSKFSGSPFYVVQTGNFSLKQGDDALKRNTADAYLVIPADFDKRLQKENGASVQLVVNAINGTSAALTSAYSSMIINDYNQNIATESGLSSGGNIDVSRQYWFNPELNYQTFMVPGILVLLVTLIGLMLSGMNVVREKEMGTIEQINATPISKYQFIAGKLLPFWILGLFELAFGLIVGKLLFDIPLIGSLWLLFGVAMVYMIVVLAAGLLISTLTNTQQQAMLLSFFFMIIFIMMSGLFTSVENMPQWAQDVNQINPIAHFINIVRMILLKGSGFADFRYDFFCLVILGSILLSASVWRYRKTA
ncbi:MAG: ABC transporter permease [Bacteroidota bacterium]